MTNLVRKVLQRDKYKCRSCGNLGKVVHHIIPKASGGLDDIDNLITLCRACHMKVHDLPTYKIIEEGKLKGIIKKCGNSGHIMVPREWLGKRVIATVEDYN